MESIKSISTIVLIFHSANNTTPYAKRMLAYNFKYNEKLNRMKEESNPIGLFLAAALAGFAIGIALAPAKGSETRKKLGNKAKNFAQQLPPVKLIRHMEKEKHDQEDFLSNVHSSSNPAQA
jgi:hypothetical protein